MMVKMTNEPGVKLDASASIPETFSQTFWPLYPLRSRARHFSQERGPIAGIAFVEPGEIVNQFPFDQDEPESYYVPTEAELLVIKEHLSESAVMAPPWHLIHAELIRSGKIQGDYGELTAPVVIALLGHRSEQLTDSDASPTVHYDCEPPIDLLFELSNQSRKILTFLWDGCEVQINDLEQHLSPDTPRTLDAQRKAINRLNDSLSKIDKCNLEVLRRGKNVWLERRE